MDNNKTYDEKEDTYTFSASKRDIFVGKRIYVFVAIGFLIILLLETFSFLYDSSIVEPRFPIVSIVFVLPALSFLSLIVYLVFYKFAYRMVVDYKHGTITFFLFRRKKPVCRYLRELEIVRIGAHIHFCFRDGQSIWYRVNDLSIFAWMRDRIIPMEWGIHGKSQWKKEFVEITSKKLEP